jgi:hypothetical protein
MGVETVISSAADQVASAVMAASIIAAGVVLVLLARAAGRGRPGARSPIIVWQLMQLSVAYLTWGTSWVALGVALVILAVAAVGTALWPGVFEEDVPDF